MIATAAPRGVEYVRSRPENKLCRQNTGGSLSGSFLRLGQPVPARPDILSVPGRAGMVARFGPDLISVLHKTRNRLEEAGSCRPRSRDGELAGFSGQGQI